ncbi:Xaa-Pro peptidase family protein [Bacillus sp. FSL W8-0116]|uniref:M24 family metallopeptidase n=1 Tax=Bacillus sp. FSL W8-0116 TaxID=2978206 RepID=UPI0030F8FB63
MNSRLRNLIDWMKETETDFSFITLPDNVFYFTNYRSDPHERVLAVGVFQREEPFLICPQMEAKEAKKAGWEHEIIGYSDIVNPWEEIEKAVKSRLNSVRKIALEKEHLNISRYEQLASRFSDASFTGLDDTLNQLRMIKDVEEIQLMRKAAEYADYAVQVGVSELKEGKTELEIIAAIEYELKKKGISEMSFATMVLTGKNASSPHGTPGASKVKKGDLVLFDLGVVYKGYCSDITRTVAYGDITDEQETIYQTVLTAQQTAVRAVKPGVPLKELDLTARNIISQAGYGEYFSHRLGHGLGISVHEYPYVTETNDLALKKGMVFTIEPGIYVQEKAGVRIEDDVVVTDKGVEVLTKYPKELQIIK